MPRENEEGNNANDCPNSQKEIQGLIDNKTIKNHGRESSSF